MYYHMIDHLNYSYSKLVNIFGYFVYICIYIYMKPCHNIVRRLIKLWSVVVCFSTLGLSLAVTGQGKK